MTNEGMDRLLTEILRRNFERESWCVDKDPMARLDEEDTIEPGAYVPDEQGRSSVAVRLTREQLDQVIGAQPMVERLAAWTSRKRLEYGSMLAEPTLDPTRAALFERLRPSVDRLAHLRPIREHVLFDDLSKGELRTIVGAILLGETKHFDLRDVEDFESLVWARVVTRLEEWIVMELVVRGMTKMGGAMSKEFAMVESTDAGEPASWDPFEDALWAFTTAYSLGVMGAAVRLDREAGDRAKALTIDLIVQLGPIVEGLPVDQRDVLVRRLHGHNPERLAKESNRPVGDVLRQLHAIIREVATRWREVLAASAQPPPIVD